MSDHEDLERVTVQLAPRTLSGTIKPTKVPGRYWFVADGHSAMLFVTDEEILRDSDALATDDQVLLEGRPGVVLSVSAAGVQVETLDGVFTVDPDRVKRVGS